MAKAAIPRTVEDIYRMHVIHRLKSLHEEFAELLSISPHYFTVNFGYGISLSADEQTTCQEVMNTLYRKNEPSPQQFSAIYEMKSKTVALKWLITALFENGVIKWWKIFQVLDYIEESIMSDVRYMMLIDLFCHYSVTLRVGGDGATIADWIYRIGKGNQPAIAGDELLVFQQENQPAIAGDEFGDKPAISSQGPESTGLASMEDNPVGRKKEEEENIDDKFSSSFGGQFLQESGIQPTTMVDEPKDITPPLSTDVAQNAPTTAEREDSIGEIGEIEGLGDFLAGFLDDQITDQQGNPPNTVVDEIIGAPVLPPEEVTQDPPTGLEEENPTEQENERPKELREIFAGFFDDEPEEENIPTARRDDYVSVPWPSLAEEQPNTWTTLGGEYAEVELREAEELAKALADFFGAQATCEQGDQLATTGDELYGNLASFGMTEEDPAEIAIREAEEEEEMFFGFF